RLGVVDQLLGLIVGAKFGIDHEIGEAKEMIACSGADLVTKVDLADLIITRASQAVNVEAPAQIEIGLREAVHPVCRENASGPAIAKIVVESVFQSFPGQNDLGPASIELPIFFTEAKISPQIDFASQQSCRF